MANPMALLVMKLKFRDLTAWILCDKRIAVAVIVNMELVFNYADEDTMESL